MKIIISSILLLGLSSQLLAKECNIVDTMYNSTERNFLVGESFKLNFSKRDLRENHFKTKKIEDIKVGDFVYNIVKSYPENDREKFALGHCMLTGVIGIATFGSKDVECMVPGEALEITTIQLARLKTRAEGKDDFEVVNEFDVETEWNGPNLPNLTKNLISSSKSELLPCSYY